MAWYVTGLAVALLGLGVARAQNVEFENTTGTRSLWIPYKTWSGVPEATIIGTEQNPNATVYVISCPTGDSVCDLGANFTLTQGTEKAVWQSTTSGSETSGSVSIGCQTLDSPPITCNQRAVAGAIVRSTSEVVSDADVRYRAVDVTAALNTTSGPPTVTVTAEPETTSSSSTTSSSEGDAMPLTQAPWGFGGLVGAGLLAVAAL